MFLLLWVKRFVLCYYFQAVWGQVYASLHLHVYLVRPFEDFEYLSHVPLLVIFFSVVRLFGKCVLVRQASKCGHHVWGSPCSLQLVNDSHGAQRPNPYGKLCVADLGFVEWHQHSLILAVFFHAVHQ